MENEDKILEPKEIAATEKSSPNAAFNVFQVTSNFNSLFAIIRSKEILDEEYLKIIFRNLECEGIEDKHINTLVTHMHSEMKKYAIKSAMKDIEKSLRDFFDKDKLWQGVSCYVGEENGKMFLYQKDKKNVVTGKEYVSNFVLRAKYKLEVNNQDCKETYFAYDLIVDNDYGKKYTVKFISSDFFTMKEFQTRIKEQASTSGFAVHDIYNHMRGVFHRYVTLGDFSVTKIGTNVLGYERLSDTGDKYFCLPDGNVLDKDGEISEELLYIGQDSGEIDKSVILSLTNMTYDKSSWKTNVLPILARNVMQLHTLDNMLLVWGWMAAVPHESNLRKRCFQSFPILHVAGKSGAGKSTIFQALSEYLGYSSSTIQTYPSPAALQKSLTTGYTIVSIMDEYGGSDKAGGWTQTKYNDIHKVLKDVFGKSIVKKAGKGEGGQGIFYYKTRNCLVSIGQTFIQDISVATRAAQVYVYDAFHASPEGKKAKEAASVLHEAPDKNFWTGYNLWCMNQSDEEIIDRAKAYRGIVESNHEKMNSRQKDIAATIMTGLYSFKKMCKEYGLHEKDIGFTDADIERVPSIMLEITMVANGEEDHRDILYEFLQDISNDGHTIGNTPIHGTIYGKGYNVCTHLPTQGDSGKYGKHAKDACIFGQETLLIDVPAMCNYLNRKLGKDKYSSSDLNVYIQAEFKKAMQDEGRGMVLAPNGYRVKHKGHDKKYTAFSKAFVTDIFPEFDSIKFYDA